MTKEKIEEEIPELGDIAEQIKQLGSQLKAVFEAAAQSEHGKQAQQQVLDGFDFLAAKTGKVIDDAKSGKLERDVKISLHQTLKNINEKLQEYADSIRSSKKNKSEEPKKEQ